MGSITRSFANNIGSSGILTASAVTNATVEDITSFDNAASPATLVLLSTQTASSSASIEFTTGLDSTYDEYIFKFINIHPATDNAELQFNFSTDGGSNYNVTKTTTFFLAQHDEADTYTSLEYGSSRDLAQSTSNQYISVGVGNDNDQNVNGYLQLFNPSSTTYVKHYISSTNSSQGSDYSVNSYSAGYGNTTSAVDAIQFKFDAGNIDDGIIKLYGVKKS
jgi:hypothetical protein